MSLLAKKVARLESARALVAQLENELVVDLNLAPPVRKYGARIGPLRAARLAADLGEELGEENGAVRPRGQSKFRSSGWSTKKTSPETVAEILRRVKAGESDMAIGRVLGISGKTVGNYRKGARLPANFSPSAPLPRAEATPKIKSGLTDDLIAVIKAGPPPGEESGHYAKRLGMGRDKLHAAVLAGPNEGESKRAHAKRLGISLNTYWGIKNRDKAKAKA